MFAGGAGASTAASVSAGALALETAPAGDNGRGGRQVEERPVAARGGGFERKVRK